jgi:hypothetical protein
MFFTSSGDTEDPIGDEGFGDLDPDALAVLTSQDIDKETSAARGFMRSAAATAVMPDAAARRSCPRPSSWPAVKRSTA